MRHFYAFGLLNGGPGRGEEIPAVLTRYANLNRTATPLAWGGGNQPDVSKPS